MKRRTAKLFEDLGLDLSTEINIFLSPSLRGEGPPIHSQLSQFDREMEEAETSSIMIEFEFVYTQKLCFMSRKSASSSSA